jgi:sulfur carrier protein
MIQVTVNGEEREYNQALSVAALLENLELGNRRVAVMRNGGIVEHATYEDTLVRGGDTVEVIHMVGGG